MSEIDNVIEKIVSKKTFSLEAVEAIKILRDELNACRIDIKLSEKSCDDYKDKNSKLTSDFHKVDKELKIYMDRDRSLVDRENKMTKLECDVEKEAAVANAYKYLLETVFKPSGMREEIWKSHQDRYEGSPEKVETGHSKITTQE